MILLMISRLIRHLVVFLLITIPLQIIGLFLLSVILPFIPRFQEKLPRTVIWFDNWSSYEKGDYPVGDGLAGDVPYRTGRGLTHIQNPSRIKLYLGRLVWLGLRNPLNYFQYDKLGFHWVESSIYSLVTTGTINVGDQSEPGFRYTEVVIRNLDTNKKDIKYEYYYVKKYKLFGERCVVLRFGWKIGSSIVENPIGSTTQWVLNFNPFKPYRGV